MCISEDQRTEQQENIIDLDLVASSVDEDVDDIVEDTESEDEFEGYDEEEEQRRDILIQKLQETLTAMEEKSSQWRASVEYQRKEIAEMRNNQNSLRALFASNVSAQIDPLNQIMSDSPRNPIEEAPIMDDMPEDLGVDKSPN